MEHRTSRRTAASRRCTSTTTTRRTTTADDFVDADDRRRAGQRPALRHSQRHPLRVLGFRARAHQRPAHAAIRADRRPHADRRLHLRAERDLTEDRGEQTIWLQRNGFDYHRVRYQRSRGHAGPAARVHRRQQGLRLRTAASRAEERAEVDWASTRTGKSARTSRIVVRLPRLEGAQPAERRHHRRRPDRIQRRRQGAEHLPRSPIRPNPADPAATIPCRNASNFWTQTFNFNNGLPVASRTLVSVAARGLCRHGRQCRLRVRPDAAWARRSCASRTRTKLPTSSSRASTASST